MKKFFHCISSFIFPITLEKRTGKLNPYLEVVYSQGKLKLNSRTVNYSDDKTHDVFRKTFIKFNIREQDIKNVLILGFGTGSIANIFTSEYNMNCRIVGVEADETVIELGKKYFGLSAIKNLILHCEDAYNFVLTCEEKYDLIAMDAFIDKYVPRKFHEEKFIKSLVGLLNEKCILFFNYISFDDKTERGLNHIFKLLKSQSGTVTKAPFSVTGIGNIVLVYQK